MTDTERPLHALYHAWVSAEDRYAQTLEAFTGDGPPAVVMQDSALKLAQARNRADSARDKFFRQALR